MATLDDKPITHLANATVASKEDIDIRAEKEENVCNITGLTMMEGDTIIAIVDWKNCSVKLVDIEQKRVVSQIALPCAPWDITQVKHDTVHDELAVTLNQAEKIQFIKVTGTSMSLHRDLEVSGKCSGIVHNDGKLVVSFSTPPNGHVEIVSMSGQVLNTVSTQPDGQPLFVGPIHLALSVDKSLLYVSDKICNSVFCLNMDGDQVTLKSTYSGEGLRDLEGVYAAEDGSVIVTGSSSRSVYVLSADCTGGRVLVDDTQGLRSPSGVAYSRSRSTLYVVQKIGDTMAAFKLKQARGNLKISFLSMVK